MLIAFLEPVSFLVINFPNLYAHPIASGKLAANYTKLLQIEAPWPKHSIKNSRHFTYSKIKLSIFFLGLLLLWIGLLLYWPSVGAWYLTTTPTLCSFVPLSSTVVALPHELPLWGNQLHWRISSPILLYGDQNRLFLFSLLGLRLPYCS